MVANLSKETTTKMPTNKLSKEEILNDFYIAHLSRLISKSIRREVLTGKAKFGLDAGGKELLQLAMAKTFDNGDFFSGYYRDQTFMMSKGIATTEQLFASLYADTENDPYSGGRNMNSHFSTPLVDKKGNWTEHKERYNVISALAPLAAQVPRALGLALASKAYRANDAIATSTQFSNGGNEVSFVTTGDATTSQGVFFETVNAAGVMRVPMAFVIQDDGYGISVPTELQTTKGSISEVLEGFRVNEKGEGLDIYTVKAWDYEALVETFEKGVAKIRATHIPAIFHVQECTQPFGHSTSGSHERYKSKERLQWEKDMDGLKMLEDWILENKLASQAELDELRVQAAAAEKEGRKSAWKKFQAPVKVAITEIQAIFQTILQNTAYQAEAVKLVQEIKTLMNPVWTEIVKIADEMRMLILGETHEGVQQLEAWIAKSNETGKDKYSDHLYSNTSKSALRVPAVPARYEADAPMKNGFEILNAFFDITLEKYPNVYAFGEDVGKIGDVNQGFADMQKKYGIDRVFDTGIREWTIAGQGTGMAMRGLRPIAEIQYLDYLAYAFAALTDDLATLRYRSNGQQIAPVIIRTRGHRLEGIWHSGSPMGMLVNSMRGIYVLTPRNMTQAAGMYNTMLQSDDPCIMIECLNGYRLKEKMPSNLSDFAVPLGVPEVLKKGDDVTLVTYGSCVRVAEKAVDALAKKGINVELIDVQTLLPFDLEHRILASLEKTNRIVFLDEDVPGGATAYMMQEVLEKQGGYGFLDSAPLTITAKAYRPPFGDDGDYFSKPQVRDIFNAILNLMQEVEPNKYNTTNNNFKTYSLN